MSCETIKKCFKKAGILTDGFEIVTMPPADDDPFANCDSEALECTTVDTDSELDGLISQLQVNDACSAEELIGREDIIPICNDEACWEESLS